MLRKTRQFEPNNADGARRAANRDKTYERLGRVLPSASSSTLIRGIPVKAASDNSSPGHAAGVEWVGHLRKDILIGLFADETVAQKSARTRSNEYRVG